LIRNKFEQHNELTHCQVILSEYSMFLTSIVVYDDDDVVAAVVVVAAAVVDVVLLLLFIKKECIFMRRDIFCADPKPFLLVFVDD